MLNVLVTASGGDIGQGVIKSLRLSKYKNNIKLITTDMNELAVGLFLGDKGYIIAPAKQNKNSYLRQLKNICHKEKIDIAFICNEDEQLLIAANINTPRKTINTKFIVQPLRVIKIANDKFNTCVELSSKNISCPKSCVGKKNILSFAKKYGYPVILKPRMGYGDFDKFKIINNKKSLLAYLENNGLKNTICQEYITNKKDEEYTVGIFLDNNSKSIGAIAMLRQLRFGSTWHAIIDNYSDITKFAIKAAEAINAIGPCNVQIRQDKNNKPYVIEINARISGTTAFRALAGFNEAEASIDYFLKKIKPKFNFKKRLVLMKTMDDLAVPYDKYSQLKRKGNVTN